MNQKRIRVSIDPIGNSKVEAIGYNGVGCEDATSNIEKALAGGGGMSRVIKDEWHNPNTEEQTNEQGIPAW